MTTAVRTTLSLLCRRIAFSPGDLILGVAAVPWLFVATFYCARDVDPFFWFLVAVMSPVVAPLWLAVPAWALVIVVLRLRSRAYAAAGLAALIPAIALVIMDYGPSLGVRLRFWLERPAYMARIEAARAGAIDFEIVSGSPIVAFFPWSSTAIGSYGVVYDESGVIEKPLAERQAAWRYRGVPGELVCSGDAWRLSGHFYMGDFAC